MELEKYARRNKKLVGTSKARFRSGGVQSDGIGRNIIDNFETALRRYYNHKTKDMKGYIVAFSFTKGVYEEVARVKKEWMEIELIKVQDILDKKLVMKIH